jgi:hypothetical protein
MSLYFQFHSTASHVKELSGVCFLLSLLEVETPSDEEDTEYQRMTDALKQLAATTRKTPFVFSLCQWGWVSHLFLLWIPELM